MAITRTGPALVLALAALGCAGSFGDSDVNLLRGTLGEAELYGVPEIREVRERPGELHVDLRMFDARGRWAAMVAVTIPRDVAEDGTPLAYRTEEADILACSGPEEEEWDFDCHPDDFSVLVHESKEGIELDFEGAFYDCDDLPPDLGDEGQSIGGSIDIDLI